MIRKAQHEDLDAIMHIVNEAQESLRLLGIDQWQDGYPSLDVISKDVEKGVGYVLVDDDNEVIGYAAIVFYGEDTYTQLPDDVWHTTNEYVVVHRLCISTSRCRSGAATSLMYHAAKLSRELGIYGFRIDTHRGNIRMLSMLTKLGFDYCGVIYYPSGERLAYDLNLQTSKIL